MNKFDHLHMTDGCRRTDEMLAWKINKIVEWINEHDKGDMNIIREQRAGGEHDPK